MIDPQAKIYRIGCDAFGKDNLDDRQERLLRFLEEAVELVRAGGLSHKNVIDVVNFEFGRNKGQDVAQEFGGAGCTLFAAAESFGMNLLGLVGVEIDRVAAMAHGEAKAKHAKKPSSVKSLARAGLEAQFSAEGKGAPLTPDYDGDAA